MLKHTGIGLISASLLLAGCGGGSDSASDLTYDGPTAPVAINTSNADAVGGFAAAQATSSTPGSDTLSGVAITSSENGTQELGLSVLAQVTKKIADLALASPSSDAETLAGIGTTSTTACSGGGTITTTAPSTYNQDDLSSITNGDTVSIVFNNCIETDPDSDITEQTNGAVSIVYISTSFVDQETFNFSASYIYDNLKVTNQSNGDHTWVNGTITQANISQSGVGTPIVMSLSGSSMVSETNYAGMVQRVLLSDFSFFNSINFTTFELIFDNNFTVASSVVGGTVTVKTITPFTVNLFNPSSPSTGQLMVTGAENASVRLTVVDPYNVTLEYDFDGDGIYGNGTDPIMKTTTWSTL